MGSGFLTLKHFRELVERNPWVQDVELSNYGEIFLNPDLLAMLEYAHHRGVALRADNGVNLNYVKPSVIEGLVKYGFQSMTCSIDGASNETYSQYRVRGHFDTVIDHKRAINRFKEHRSGPRNLDSGLSEIFIVFQAAVPTLVASKYTTSGVRRPSAL